MIYLYVKTHTITGLKYLGKTTSKDPHKYRGSGVYWRRHLQAHGYTFTTQILLASSDPREIEETGVFFSRLWNIVMSREWANLMEEKGNGVDAYTARKTAIRRIEEGTHPFTGPNRTYAMNNNARERKGMSYEQIYGKEKAVELKKSRSKSNTVRWRDEAFKTKTSEKISQTRKDKFTSGELVAHNKGKKCPIAKQRRDDIRRGFEESGLSKDEYARQLNISVITLRKHLRTVD